MRSINRDSEIHISFVSANAKVAPQGASTIPRLELCAAAHATLSAHDVLRSLSLYPARVTYYTDSKIVLGYLHNLHRRFQRYVTRRIGIILNLSSSSQWKYINSSSNPADLATRPQTPEELKQSMWFSGPEFLWRGIELENYCAGDEALPEEQPANRVMLTMKKDSVMTDLCQRLNNWHKVLRVVMIISSLARKFDVIKQKMGMSIACRNPHVTTVEAAKLMVKLAQRESFGNAVISLTKHRQLTDGHMLAGLSPFVDIDGCLRVGGRIHHSSIPADHKHPLLLPENHPVTSLLVASVHLSVCHQGRHLTHGAVRQNGYHIVNGRKVIRKLIAGCSACKKLRGPPVQQQMAQLPPDRLEESPPFSNTGVDVFGPFFIHDGVSTRRTNASKKIWIVIFVCLVSRGVHVEPLPGMDTSSMRNAMFRFMAIRGVCRILRSDNGGNFVAAQKQVEKEGTINIESIKQDLGTRNCEWIFSPPKASNYSGAWERKIGSVRRVFEGSMLLLSNKKLSRDEFHTLIIEVAAIVNNTPLWETSDCPDDPAPLCPAALLTFREKSNSASTEYTETDLLQYGKARWRRVQYLADQFWVRYRSEYLHTLQKRHKWCTRKPCIAVGDVVMICNKSEKRNTWPMARVVEVVRSTDDIVRKVYIKLPGKGVLLRSIHQLVLITKGSDHGDCKISAEF